MSPYQHTHTHINTGVSILKAWGWPSGINVTPACGWISRQPISSTHWSLSAVYCCGFQLSIKCSLTSVENDLMEMMEETERDKACLLYGSNHLILLPWCIGFVCVCGFVSTPINGERKKKVRRKTQSDIRDQGQQKEKADKKKVKQKVRDAFGKKKKISSTWQADY